MNILGKLLLGIIATQFLVSSPKKENQNFTKHCHKIYVKPDDVYIEKNKICICLNGEFFPASVISKDKAGVFAILEGVYVIICPDCHLEVDIDNQSPVCPHPWFINN